jgi:hypothetical protein
MMTFCPRAQEETSLELHGLDSPYRLLLAGRVAFFARLTLRPRLLPCGGEGLRVAIP